MSGDIKSGAFTLLSGELLTYVPFNRFNSEFIAITPSNGNVEYYVPYSEREQRPLFIFDGDVPQNGLAKTARQIHLEIVGVLEQSPAHTRKVKEYELSIPLPTYLYRRFMIIPQGRGVIMRYRKRSIAHRYVMVETRHLHDTTWSCDIRTSTF